MPGFGDTTAMLARLRRRNPDKIERRSVGRLVESPTPSANPGALRMLSYAPVGLPKGAPLVVVLHGCTQTAEEYASGAGWLELADRLGFAVLAPEQASSNNINLCFNWFLDGDVRRGHGEAASIAEMLLAMAETYALDLTRIFVTGLSAGGAMTAVMLAAYPELFAGGAIIAGLPYGVANSVPKAMKAMYAGATENREQLGALVNKSAGDRSDPVRISIWHGDADTTVTPANGEALAAQWSSAYGLPSAPSSVDKFAHHTRSRWTAPGADGSVVELNVVRGLGHGTPLSTRAPDGVGAAGPFMLEAGVSSTLEIAAFWGLEPNLALEPLRAAIDENFEPTLQPRPAERPRLKPLSIVMGAMEGRVPAEVKTIVDKALRSAGLDT